MSASKLQRRAYRSDLTLAQWNILSPMLPPNTGRGRHNIHDLKDIVDAILYINVNGCTWVDLPHDFPPATSVSHHDCKWSKDGTWRRINDTLREAVREHAGRDPHPSLGAIDSQTTKAAATGGERGYDGGKRTNGRKKHILVDTLGLLIVVVVTAASVSDAAGAVGLLKRISVVAQRSARSTKSCSQHTTQQRVAINQTEFVTTRGPLPEFHGSINPGFRSLQRTARITVRFYMSILHGSGMRSRDHPARRVQRDSFRCGIGGSWSGRLGG